MKSNKKEKYVEIRKETDGAFKGEEKTFFVQKKGNLVYSASIKDKSKIREAAREALEKINVSSLLSQNKKVYIKVNIGGGITGLYGTYSEPDVLKELILCFKETGAQVFVCEGDMRGFTMTGSLLRKRGILQVLEQTKTSFVALSHVPRVEIKCHDVDIPLFMPKIFFEDDAVVVSFAPIKYHWECGVTLTQKNMFGALSVGEKSIYHRDIRRLDPVIAAAARVMKPQICILGGHMISSGIGPHFSVPLEFHALVFSNNAWAGDKFVSDEILGYPYDKVQYAMVNCKNKPEDIEITVADGSVKLEADVIACVRNFPVKPDDTIFWRNFLALQYLTPHPLQRPLAGALEVPFALLNRAIFSWQGRRLERRKQGAGSRVKEKLLKQKSKLWMN